ncbi:sugar porter (SP) family MFS transporter [Gibbsiella quercinecans]|uniref:MFS transporter n=1 Tax=Gibbsiella quercinecans TaxID=929813 RepID=A0A250AWF6_9GAMM|nr:sugar porter family MFS transporter [Gibbsiella quercinecans]ATA18259.1 MFS transporter [Gibbsiella quercinecans]RLM10554.1 MFS transporter [Gibbsiella quercinecans]RLM12984.1 MFS transporter [Gibbsiella quercinecans]RLM14530.1 MFS transporter [Gibbsiella quercinecans]TCT90835.1 sugar porter (SP) family MFS transporter [Gibbsiella quercinecans]
MDSHDSTLSQTSETPRAVTVRQRIFFVVLVATMGALAFGYDTGIISGALPYMSSPTAEGGLGLTSFTEGLVASSLVFGAAIGSFLSGFFSDKFGRRITLRSLAVLFVVGSLGTALAPSVSTMVAMRFLLGIAVGGGSSTVPVFIAEIAGPKLRAPLVSRNELMIVTGQLVAYVVSALLSYLLHDGHLWRYMLAIAMVPGVLLFLGTFFVPVSPHWLVGEGRHEEAREVLHELRETPHEVQKELKQMRKQAKEAERGPDVMTLIREKWVLRLLVIGIGLGFALQFTGVNAFMYYTPIILKSTGLGTTAAITATIGNGVVSVIATIAGIWAVSRFSRRHMLITGFCFVIFAQLSLGAVLTLLSADLTQSFIALGCILIFLFFMQMFIAPVYWLLMSELFPMQLRGRLTGTAISLQWIFNALVAFSFPPLMAFAGSKTFFIFALINVGSLLFIMLMVPETRGKSLEEIETHMREKYGENNDKATQA